MRWLLSVLLACGLVAGSVAGERECRSATCRVQWSGGIGTGVAYYGTRGDDIYVMTAKHVVNGADEVDAEFFFGTPFRKVVRGSVIVAKGAVDIAVIRIPKRLFGKTLPAIIPWSRQKPRAGDTLFSIGYRYGEKPTAFQTKVVEYRGDDMVFDTMPAEGRSGSGIFDEKWEHVVGILTARDDASKVGIAECLDDFVEATGSKKDLQCGPNGCPSPNIRQFGAINIAPRQQQAPIPSWDAPGEPMQVTSSDEEARKAITENRAQINNNSAEIDKNRKEIIGISSRVSILDGKPSVTQGDLAAIDAKATEAKDESVAAKAAAAAVEQGVASKLGGYAKSWIVWALGGLGVPALLASLISIVAVWVLRGKIKTVVQEKAMPVAMGIDRITDRIPGEWDDRLVDGLAYKLAEVLSGEQRPANWDTPNEAPVRRPTKKNPAKR